MKIDISGKGESNTTFSTLNYDSIYILPIHSEKVTSLQYKYFDINNSY